MKHNHPNYSPDRFEWAKFSLTIPRPISCVQKKSMARIYVSRALVGSWWPGRPKKDEKYIKSSGKIVERLLERDINWTYNSGQLHISCRSPLLL
jgi:hypothetical protein